MEFLHLSFSIVAFYIGFRIPKRKISLAALFLLCVGYSAVCSNVLISFNRYALIAICVLICFTCYNLGRLFLLKSLIYRIISSVVVLGVFIAIIKFDLAFRIEEIFESIPKPVTKEQIEKYKKYEFDELRIQMAPWHISSDTSLYYLSYHSEGDEFTLYEMELLIRNPKTNPLAIIKITYYISDPYKSQHPTETQKTSFKDTLKSSSSIAHCIVLLDSLNKFRMQTALPQSVCFGCPTYYFYSRTPSDSTAYTFTDVDQQKNKVAIFINRILSDSVIFPRTKKYFDSFYEIGQRAK